MAEPAATPAPAVPVPPPAVPSVKTVIVVRHAEAEPGPRGGDPALSADGRARAVELARTLVDTQLRTVYTTKLQRSRQTALPLPRGAGEKPTVIDDVPAIVRAVRAEPWGSTVLVINHSHTLAELLRGLTGRAMPDDEVYLYDRIWVVTLARDGGASLLRLHYGAPVPVPPPGPPAPK